MEFNSVVDGRTLALTEIYDAPGYIGSILIKDQQTPERCWLAQGTSDGCLYALDPGENLAPADWLARVFANRRPKA
ncbi:MAG TPA: hypothetical protein VGY54_12475 [Polyangiaceae bacterium]|jgi:hypothetical protein|nr:hypothetical protein [Polyangiaceae bacterium]